VERVVGRWSVPVALAVYVLAAAVFFLRPVASSARVTCICAAGPNPDPTLFMWGLEWWPRSLAFGNPLVSEEVFFPAGAELAQVTTVPAPALALAPGTALFGPVFSYNVAITLAPALAAFFAFLLARRLTGAFWPALAGGWFFGFSTYVFAHMTGHLNLALVFLVPALVHLVVRHAEGDLRDRSFVALAALALLFQMLTSTEVLLTLTVFGWATLALAALLAPEWRARLRRTALRLALAFAVAGAAGSPYLLSALGDGGPVSQEGTTLTLDLASFVLPSQITELGRDISFRVTPAEFQLGWGENGGYFGVVLLAMAIAAAVRTWERPRTRVIVTAALVTAIAAMGSRLLVASRETIPMPWGLVDGLPLLEGAIPIRFAVFTGLGVAMLGAIWLALPRRRAWPAWAAAVLAALMLAPNLGASYWYKRMDIPPFFGDGTWQSELRDNDVVLVLPHKFTGKAMLWQAWTGIGFTMAGGYFGENWRDPDRREPIFPIFQDQRRPIGFETIGHTRGYLERHGVTVALVDPIQAGPWPRLLTEVGWRGRELGGLQVWRPA